MAASRIGSSQSTGRLAVGSEGSFPAPFDVARLGRWAVVLAVLAFTGLGALGIYRYVDNYWLYRGYAAPHDPSWVRNRGTAQTIGVWSPAVGRTQQVIVYLPPGYGSHPHERYPTIYLLHGSPGLPNAMLLTVKSGVVEDEFVAQHRVRPAIIVMPSGSPGRFADTEWANGVGRRAAWETFLARDVVRAIDRRYRTIPRGADRALAGLSEGGYGALNIGLHHPGEFHVLESWSGYMQADDIVSVFGHGHGRLAANSPALVAPALARRLRREHTFIWFYSSHGDRLFRQNVAFAHELHRLRIPYHFSVVSGGHTWRTWRDNFPSALLAASARLRHA
jgi:enterochelin esterase-like enzyme